MERSWIGHGDGNCLSIGASGLVPSELSKSLFSQEDVVIDTDCSEFLTRARDIGRMNSYFSGGKGSPIGFDEDAARRGGYSSESVALAKDLATYSDTFARSNPGDSRIRPHSSLGYRPLAPDALLHADPVFVPVGLT